MSGGQEALGKLFEDLHHGVLQEVHEHLNLFIRPEVAPIWKDKINGILRRRFDEWFKTRIVGTLGAVPSRNRLELKEEARAFSLDVMFEAGMRRPKWLHTDLWTERPERVCQGLGHVPGKTLEEGPVRCTRCGEIAGFNMPRGFIPADMEPAEFENLSPGTSPHEPS